MSLQLQGKIGVKYPVQAMPQTLALARQLVARVSLLEAQGAADADVMDCYRQLQMLGVTFQNLETTALTVNGALPTVPRRK